MQGTTKAVVGSNAAPRGFFCTWLASLMAVSLCVRNPLHLLSRMLDWIILFVYLESVQMLTCLSLARMRYLMRSLFCLQRDAVGRKGLDLHVGVECPWIMVYSAGGERLLLELTYDPAQGLWGGPSRMCEKRLVVRPRNDRDDTSLWLKRWILGLRW